MIRATLAGVMRVLWPNTAGGFSENFLVESAEPGVGVHGRDLLRDEPVFLIDISFSRSAVPGMILASRLTGYF